MQLIQILLPLADNEGQPFAPEMFSRLRDRLAAKFGGVTAFTQAPAEGSWQPEGDSVQRDRIVIFEVMVEELDRGFWSGFRQNLERDFRQDQVVVRASPIVLL